MADTVLTKVSELLWRILESYRIDPLPLFVETHIDPATMDDMSSRINRPTMAFLWQATAERVNDPCFALGAGELWHPSYMHALGYAWLSSSSLRTAFDRLSRFIHIVNRDLEVKLDQQPTRLAIEILDTSLTQGREDFWYADCDMSILLAMCRANCGQRMAPVAMQFKREKPPCNERYESLFRCPVEFGAAHNRMFLDNDTVDRHLTGSNPMMSQIHDQEMVRYLAALDGNDIIQRVKGVIIERLADGRITEDKVAEALFMSKRNLQRQLEARNTTFKTLLTEVRKSLALKYIGNRQLTLTEISFLLGFSEISAFSRAFKHWTGNSPRHQRSVVNRSQTNPPG